MPEQTVPDAAVAVTVGVGFTVTVMLCVAVQPKVVVLVTVYVVVVEGDAFVFAAFGADKPADGLQTKVPVPTGEASRFTESPGQMEADNGLTFRIAAGFTVIVRVEVLLHPAADVPVTVYVVVVVGKTVTVVPLKLPGIQVYVLPPCPVMVVLSPAQIVAAVVVVEIVGSGFTVTVTVDVFEQPGPLEPVTVYVVVAVGETVTVVPLMLPGAQV